MNIFELAARRKFRFNSSKGKLTVEQLFDLPLTSSGGDVSLDAIARAVNSELKATTEESFVEVRQNSRATDLAVMLDIAKHVIKLRQDDAENMRKRVRQREERSILLDALAKKKDEELSSLDVKEIERRLAELDEV